jgi:hypothetical protein
VAGGTFGSSGVQVVNSSGFWDLTADINGGKILVDGIDDVTIRGNGYMVNAFGFDCALEVRNCDNFEVRDIYLENGSDANAKFENLTEPTLGVPGGFLDCDSAAGDGVYARNVTDFEMWVEVDDQADHGLKLRECENGVIEGGDRPNQDFGKDWLDMRHCTNLEIAHFEVMDCGQEGVDVDRCFDIQFRDVDVAKVSSDGYEITRSYGVLLFDCDIADIAYSGVDVSRGSELIVVAGCTVDQAFDFPVKIYKESTGVSAFNSFSNNAPSNDPSVDGDSLLFVIP